MTDFRLFCAGMLLGAAALIVGKYLYLPTNMFTIAYYIRMIVVMLFSGAAVVVAASLMSYKHKR